MYYIYPYKQVFANIPQMKLQCEKQIGEGNALVASGIAILFLTLFVIVPTGLVGQTVVFGKKKTQQLRLTQQSFVLCAFCTVGVGN